MIEGKVAVVTGGSRGMGAIIAEKLAQEGADVAVIYAGNEEKANAVCDKCITANNVRAGAYKCDVADFKSVKETVVALKKDFGTVDILINNAGVTRDKLLAMMKESEFDEVVDTSLKGAFNMVRHCCGLMIKNNGGCIINMSSVSGLMGNPGQVNYSAAKAGLVGLTKSVAKELAGKNIRCNAVAPGFIDTDMTKELLKQNPDLLNAVPLKRAGRPEDVADAVMFLIKAEYITGAVLRVDGGIAM